ncbi:nuclear transport factor 2 family protein [Nocardia sp. NPDC051990]|uniref:nuclear transport factor 2 family protein n=1 Tax=Nocardia sp. NPDC051990 TaxID=3155285 RepID=UPI00342F6260
MNHSELVAATAAYAAAKNAHDADAVAAAYAPDGVYQSVGFGEPVQGHEPLKGFYQALFTALPNYHGEFEGIAYGENTAVAWGRFGGTIAADFLGLGAHVGRVVDIPVTFVCTFRDDGLLISDVGYFDVATFCEQTGIRLAAVRPTIGGGFIPGYEAFWAAPDPDLVPQIGTEDLRSTWVGQPAEIVGISAYQEHIRAMTKLIPGLKVEVVDFLAEDDTVFIEFVATGTVGGQPVRFKGLDRFRFRDGRVCDGVTMYDDSVLRRALEAGSQ